MSKFLRTVGISTKDEASIVTRGQRHLHFKDEVAVVNGLSYTGVDIASIGLSGLICSLSELAGGAQFVCTLQPRMALAVIDQRIIEYQRTRLGIWICRIRTGCRDRSNRGSWRRCG